MERRRTLLKKKVRCSYCSEKFHSKPLCQSHMRTAHGLKNKIAPMEKERLYACDRCSYTSNTIHALRNHQVGWLATGFLSASLAMAMGGSINCPWLQVVKHRPSQLVNGHAREMISTDSNKITLQQFEVQGFVSDTLAKTTITLPVFREVSHDVTVTLTPSKHSNEEIDVGSA